MSTQPVVPGTRAAVIIEARGLHVAIRSVRVAGVGAPHAVEAHRIGEPSTWIDRREIAIPIPGDAPVGRWRIRLDITFEVLIGDEVVMEEVYQQTVELDLVVMSAGELRLRRALGWVTGRA